MKNFILACLLCVIFLSTALSVGNVYALGDEKLQFVYGEKIFQYSLSDHIKESKQYDLNYEINKYQRFGSTNNRITLLKHMILIGLDREVALNYIFPSLSESINTIEKNIFVAPCDAKLKINTNIENVFTITPEKIGISLDKNSLINEICENYSHKKDLTFNVPIKKTIPKVTSKDFEKFTCLRSDFSTTFATSSDDRKHNIKNALITLNKTTIAPNEVFSFNKTVGRRTLENGYRTAKIIVNNEFVDGLGGGVCQVSSTLYNAALLAGLEIVEANKHSKPITYVKSGFDAMVNFGSSDLKIKNNTNSKITIITNHSKDKARIRIFGESLDGTTFQLTNEVFNIVEPIEEIYVDEKQEHADQVQYEDECFYLKKASRGMEIKSFRKKLVDGRLVETELLRHDKFKAQNAIKIYGNKKRAEEKDAEQVCA